MKWFFVNILILSSVFMLPQNYAQPENYYKSGLAALEKNDIKNAEQLFKNSIDKNSDAASYYQLAKIYSVQNSVYERNKARDLIRKAIWKEPEKTEYRFLYAKLMNYYGRQMAYGVYKDILTIDDTNVEAMIQIGKIKEKDFNEYINSVIQDDGKPPLSFNDIAEKDFKESEKYLSKALDIDEKNRDALLNLSLLYEDNNEPIKSLPLLEKLVHLYPNDKDGHLYLGLIYYKLSNMHKAYEEYQEALILMPDSDRVDFTYNSVKKLLKPIFGKEYDKISEKDLKKLIEVYWKADDPLYLTKFNERLLEHYSRVAYANLHFSENPDSIPGWKTDKGEVILRYGEPKDKIRYRPYINAGGRTDVRMKTDVWYYNDMTFGFTDDFMSGNFRFSVPESYGRYHSQYLYDTYAYMHYIKNKRFEYYNPKFEGPKINVPYNIVQFKDLKHHNSLITDVYVNYGLKNARNNLDSNVYPLKHIYGLYFMDRNYNDIFSFKDSILAFSNEREIILNNDSLLAINSIEMNVKPDSGILAFEVIRGYDKGVAANHFSFKARNFNNNNLQLSDILLASHIGFNNSEEGSIKRKDINILPNPTKSFSKNGKVFLYFEIYNLNQNVNLQTDFSQNITVKNKNDKTGLEKAVNGVLSIFGINEKQKQLTISNNYQTHDPDPQMYLQLDMSNYDTGNYIITINIKDNISGKSVREETELVISR